MALCCSPRIAQYPLDRGPLATCLRSREVSKRSGSKQDQRSAGCIVVHSAGVSSFLIPRGRLLRSPRPPWQRSRGHLFRCGCRGQTLRLTRCAAAQTIRTWMLFTFYPPAASDNLHACFHDAPSLHPLDFLRTSAPRGRSANLLESTAPSLLDPARLAILSQAASATSRRQRNCHCDCDGGSNSGGSGGRGLQGGSRVHRRLAQLFRGLDECVAMIG